MSGMLSSPGSLTCSGLELELGAKGKFWAHYTHEKHLKLKHRPWLGWAITAFSLMYMIFCHMSEKKSALPSIYQFYNQEWSADWTVSPFRKQISVSGGCDCCYLSFFIYLLPEFCWTMWVYCWTVMVFSTFTNPWAPALSNEFLVQNLWIINAVLFSSGCYYFTARSIIFLWLIGDNIMQSKAWGSCLQDYALELADIRTWTTLQ